MKKRSSRRSKRVRKKNIFGASLIFLVLICISVAVSVYLSQKKNSINIDPTTFCPVNGSPFVTAILIDETDQLSPIQQASLKNELQKIRDEIPKYGKIEVYLIGNTKKNLLKPILSLCNPGRGDHANKLYQNARLIEKKWKDAFNNPMDKIISSLSDVSTSDESPIMESIQSISVSSFNNANNKNAKFRLIIASDMLQYTDGFNLYHLNTNTLTSFNSEYLKQMHSDLRDVKVEILLFRRTTSKKLQGHQLINFWEAFFNNQGAFIDRIYAITG
ncbi:hypothetical protein FOLKNPGA_01743 [Legionella sp. PC1000]|uniref:hypothetical protein n=1 Tax=Legionella sp. PC1000 TaxID=2746060 RepID=UPI0015FC6A07|nr:hypothetical protein [Legionella sp. PC1000]QLZ68963.1 hypothetical protein FOLKNPGA_01743 [Legionella sp. PC1000]